ncbi:SRPBCC family protein [Methylobacterium gnaphalii]|uniref:Activator of Hsp90 ATPase homologue 1/2-like C-terminal domain-containing protein n=1 Tax=Methylobacterium gnaphalii TaxID=1010610 RepID=A0A512JGB2_9HYPH|nr:SRPBCC domain-containing protein [Methylobacterium gnaphalii]GEP08991.1 hypothetical protein MGN01_08360 [Methylobacterium gnaphalii]GJD67534.1 hypothetical protein MMMDOFMJ_0449 [Methylobacterium gnaphalii]GLS51411.1 hypothetical protein GCM10007885_42680 [Methylobacterium gnaphalii]
MTEREPAVVLTRTIKAPRAEVFRAWTDPSLLQRWLAPGANVVESAETDLRVGGRFLLRTRGPDGLRHAISGTYLSIEPDRHLTQTWIYDGPLDLSAGEETLLSVDLADLGEAVTELRLTHRRITRSDVRDAYRGDWPSCFDKLKTILDH